MKNNKDTNKSKFSFSELVRDNRFIAMLSFVIAFSIWIWIAIEKSPEVQQVITDVPVQLSIENSIPEQLGLEIFGEKEFKIDVTVKGKKYVVSSLKSDDIQVIANTNYVDSPGSKTLQLKITPKDSNDDFTIVSGSSTYVDVYFDTYKEVEFVLEGAVDSNLESYIPDGCLAGDVVLSKNTVLLSGPATEINRVTGVSATATVNDVLEKTTTFDAKIDIKTTDGTELKYTQINSDDSVVTISVPVLKVVTLPTAVEFKNAPSYFINNPLKYTVYPSSVRVAIPVDAIETTKHFVVETIDFADITNSYNTFYVSANSISSYKLMDENIKRFKISVNASDLSSKSVIVPASAISIKNNREDFSVQLNTKNSVTITLVGPKADIEAINSDNVRIEVDTAEKIIMNDTTSLQGKVIVTGDYNCWAVGKYDVKVSVKSLE